MQGNRVVQDSRYDTARKRPEPGLARWTAALLFLGVGGSAISTLAAPSPDIRLNQIGFYPRSAKKAVVVYLLGAPAAPGAPGTAALPFFVATADLADTVYTGELGGEKTWAPSGEQARVADFSACEKPGLYVLGVPGKGVSHPFRIGGDIDLDLTRGALRAFYYQRASTPLAATHAGKWARNAGHPDNRVHVHASAATAARPAETVISAGKGWYDAGDYNKYVVNAGISTYTLLALYRHHSAFFDTLKLNIPESGNALPDVLDECLWNLRWMLAMQDPNDGGAYHKLTSPDFSGMVMPEADAGKRYMVQKSVTATLDLAATAAYAARLFKGFTDPLPGLSDSCLLVARKAWDWARAHPTAYYRQTELNQRFTPAIQTGEYGDGNASDEFFWAGMELYLATREDSFFVAAAPAGLPAAFGVPNWPGVATLGLYSLADEMRNGYAKIDSVAVRQRLVQAATPLRDRAAASAYAVSMNSSDFNWGSNAGLANQGMLLLQAFRATGDTGFLKASHDALDYLMGRNATGYSFVTGFGSKTPIAPHHRPSSADGVREPVPGMLVGGPNPGQQDKCIYPSALPALSYSDTECSYASNEIAINWNAPLAYLAGALEAIQGSGAGAMGIAPRSSARGIEARIHWTGGRFRLELPPGWTGTLEWFDLRGNRVGFPGEDSAEALYLFRIHAVDGRGKKVSRTGTASTIAAGRIELLP